MGKGKVGGEVKRSSKVTSPIQMLLIALLGFRDLDLHPMNDTICLIHWKLRLERLRGSESSSL
jgi:hypothetical protein